MAKHEMTEEEQKEEEQKKEILEDLEMRVLKEVEQSLAPPKGVYTRPGAEKKRDEDEL